MNVKYFRTVCRISSFILKFVAVFTLVLVFYGLFTIFLGDGNFWFTYNGPSFPLFGSGSGISVESEIKLAALYTSVFITPVSIYLFWKGGQLFSFLANGKKPFTIEFARSLKHISLVLMASDILFPLIYSLILTTIMQDGHYLSVGVGSSFLIGLILYTISETFHYGIELQRLSDETV